MEKTLTKVLYDFDQHNERKIKKIDSLELRSRIILKTLVEMNEGSSSKNRVEVKSWPISPEIKDRTGDKNIIRSVKPGKTDTRACE